MGTIEDKDGFELDVGATIKRIMSEVEIAARMPPMESCHPYECDRRRKVIIRSIWALFRRAKSETAKES